MVPSVLLVIFKFCTRIYCNYFYTLLLSVKISTGKRFFYMYLGDDDNDATTKIKYVFISNLLVYKQFETNCQRINVIVLIVLILRLSSNISIFQSYKSTKTSFAQHRKLICFFRD